MPAPIYVPILKGKDREYAALEALSADVKHLLMPLIEIPAIPYDYANERPAKSLDDHIVDIPERIRRACATMPVYLDLPWFGEEEALRNGETAFESVLLRALLSEYILSRWYQGSVLQLIWQRRRAMPRPRAVEVAFVSSSMTLTKMSTWTTW